MCALLTFAPVAVDAQVAPGNSVNCADTPTDVSYVFGTATALLEKPNATARRIATAPAESIAMVLCVIDGWARVWLVGQGKKEDALRTGWFKSGGANTADNLLAESWLDVVLRKNKLSETTWPAATKAAVLRKRVRIGFTPDQATTALGRPLRVESEETAAGITEVWIYLDQTLTFRARRVSSIKRIQ
jgi:hypothetical protein